MLESVIQALIIASVTAIASGYVNAKILEVKLKAMGEMFDLRIGAAETEIARLRNWRHDNAGNMGWVNEQRRVEYDRRQGDAQS